MTTNFLDEPESLISHGNEGTKIISRNRLSTDVPQLVRSVEFCPTEVQKTVYTVSQLNQNVKLLLEDTFLSIWVEGEISNFTVPNSGHWYFSLKDKTAQVRCAMFRGQNRKLIFTIKEGSHVLIKAKVSLYENRGDFQLIAEDMQEQGEGKLRLAYEALKKKLETAGLFDLTHKKALPAFPKTIGLITSPTGAAVHDMLNVLRRRFPCVSIIIYPTLVQGELAAPNIICAIQAAIKRNECDVLLLARGGGSLEDLWPFNNEDLAHAIYNCPIPIVSGVGHEIDFTIADFVADVRAPTPSAAAEIVTPDAAELLQLTSHRLQQITRHIQHKLINGKQQLNWVQKHLSQQHPKRRLSEKIQQIDFYELTLTRLIDQQVLRWHHLVKNVHLKLFHASPAQKIASHDHQLNLKQESLRNLMNQRLTQKKSLLANLAAKLDTLSPLATLNRGFSIVTTEDNKIVYAIDQLAVNDAIRVRLKHGSLDCRVEKINKNNKNAWH